MITRLTQPVSEADLETLARLLVDTVESGSAVSFLAPLPLERALEWWRTTIAGAHPRAVFLVARDPDGTTLHDTVIFFKRMTPA